MNRTVRFRAELYVFRAEQGGRHRPFTSGYRGSLCKGSYRGSCQIQSLQLGDFSTVFDLGAQHEVIIETLMSAPSMLHVDDDFEIREGGNTVARGCVLEVLASDTP
jgi:elongation factor Tu